MIILRKYTKSVKKKIDRTPRSNLINLISIIHLYAKNKLIYIRTNEEISIGIIQSLIFHGSIAKIHMYRDALASTKITSSTYRVQTIDKIHFCGLSGRHIERFPS